MGMTLSACHGRSHPGRKCRVHPIDDRDVAELLVVRSAFVVRLCIAMKSRGHDLLIARVR